MSEASEIEAKLTVAIGKIEAANEVRHSENKALLESLQKSIEEVLQGFPEADPSGHRRAHEAMIKKAEEKAKFWYDLRVKLADRGIWAVICVAGAGFLLYIKEKAAS